MKLLNYIENFLTLLQAGFLAAILLVFYLTFQMKEGSQEDFFSPRFEFKDGSNLLQSELTNFLYEDSHMVFEGPESAKLKVSRISVETEVTTGWKWTFVGFSCIYFSLTIGVFQIFKKIISAVSNRKPFTKENIKRIKLLGLVLLSIPVIELIVDKLVLMYYSGLYSMKYMTLDSHSFDWAMFNLSLLIYTLGFAFEQGRKLQEEQDLTI